MTLEIALSYWLFLLLAIAGIELLEGDEEIRDSARQRWPANLGLTLIAAGFASIVPVSGLAVAMWGQSNGYGLFNALALPAAVVFILSMILMSLRDYLVHLAAHKIPVLWRFHKIHHSDRKLDVTTTFRTHPLLYFLLSILNALTIVVLGLSPEAVVIHAVVALSFDLSHHTTLVLPERIDRALRPYVMTPSLHHIHHSDFHRETDSNYGVDLAIWDRLFGTYLEESERPAAVFRFGLKRFPQERADNLDSLLAAPFRRDPFS